MPDPDPATSPDPPPQPPHEPDPGDCCGEGCVRCIWDIHDEAMERYREQLAAWEARNLRR